MTQEEIDKAFEGRWRIKSESHQVAWVKGVKALCRDFFEAGILLFQNGIYIQSRKAGNTLTTVASAEEDYIRMDFDYWWSIYDKKRGKDKCLDKWMKLKQEERKNCIRATPAYVASTPDKKYRKDPLTYLNGKCWNDEIIPNNGTEQSTNKQQQQLDKLASILTD